MLELLLARDVLYCKEYGVVETLHHETTSCRASSTPIGEKEILNMSVMERVNITRIISTTTECTIISLTLLLYYTSYFFIFIYCSLPSSSLNHSAPAAECRATLVQRRGAGSSVEYPIRLIWTSLPDIENGHKHQCRGK